jgi:hypothetical protein
LAQILAAIGALKGSMGLNEWLVILAALAGPVLAVQAQKWVERAREGARRRDWVFTTLMATRQARLSPEHVRALNSIDLAFYGRRVLGAVWRGEKAQAVIDAWRDYHSHLSPAADQRPKDDAERRGWEGRSDELFVNLLDRLARATKYRFDREHLKTGSYSPEAHGNTEMEQQAMRRLLLEVLLGERALPLQIKSWPVDGAALARQEEWQRAVLARMGEARATTAPPPTE